MPGTIITNSGPSYSQEGARVPAANLIYRVTVGHDSVVISEELVARYSSRFNCGDGKIVYGDDDWLEAIFDAIMEQFPHLESEIENWSDDDMLRAVRIG